MNKVTIQIPLVSEYHHTKRSLARSNPPLDPRANLARVVVEIRAIVQARYEGLDYDYEPPTKVAVEFRNVDDDLTDVDMYFKSPKAAMLFKLSCS